MTKRRRKTLFWCAGRIFVWVPVLSVNQPAISLGWMHSTQVHGISVIWIYGKSDGFSWKDMPEIPWEETHRNSHLVTYTFRHRLYKNKRNLFALFILRNCQSSEYWTISSLPLLCAEVPFSLFEGSGGEKEVKWKHEGHLYQRQYKHHRKEIVESEWGKKKLGSNEFSVFAKLSQGCYESKERKESNGTCRSVCTSFGIPIKEDVMYKRSRILPFVMTWMTFWKYTVPCHRVTRQEEGYEVIFLISSLPPSLNLIWTPVAKTRQEIWQTRLQGNMP